MNAFTLSEMYASNKNVSLHSRNLVLISTKKKFRGKMIVTQTHTHRQLCLGFTAADPIRVFVKEKHKQGPEHITGVLYSTVPDVSAYVKVLPSPEISAELC